MKNPDSLPLLLQKGIQTLALSLPADAETKLIQYIQLLSKWNRVYNLTAIREPEAMVIKHLLDSLAIVPYLQGKRILDVGSGAGLPGIPLALALPERQFVLLDSNGKKTRFLQQVKAELALANVEVVQARIEDFKSPQCFDEVIARAFAHLDVIIAKTQRLCCPQGCILAMKGVYPAEELQALSQKQVEVYPLVVPGLLEQRHLIRIKI